jgi:hypothetical protein
MELAVVVDFWQGGFDSDKAAIKVVRIHCNWFLPPIVDNLSVTLLTCMPFNFTLIIGFQY